MANIMRLGGGAAASGSSDHVPVLGEDFTYTGSCEVIDDSDEVSGVQWRIKFYTSGTLVTNQDWVVDLFLVGGGGNGSVNPAASSSNYGVAGSGGGGGYTGTFKQLTVKAGTSYSIVIGGAAGASSALGKSVEGGQTAYYVGAAAAYRGGNGGSGGGSGGLGATSTAQAKVAGAGGSDGGNGAQGYYVAGSGQGTTTREFGETGGELYSGGGGGGSGGIMSGGAAAGGAGGGGAGGGSQGNGLAGTANTGGGGGGAGFYGMAGARLGGAGGSGIAIIRKAKN